MTHCLIQRESLSGWRGPQDEKRGNRVARDEECDFLHQTRAQSLGRIEDWVRWPGKERGNFRIQLHESTGDQAEDCSARLNRLEV